MNLQEILSIQQKMIKEERQRLDEIVIAPFIYAIAVSLAVGLAVEYAVHKVATMMENGRRKNWRFAPGELPEGTRMYDADGVEYTYRKSGSGYSWYKKVGNRYDVLPDNPQTVRAISNAFEHSFNAKTVDFSDVDPKEFDRAYSVSRLGTLEGNQGKSYSDLNDIYERERRTNSGVWNRMKARAARWQTSAGIALTLVQAFGLYQLFVQTKELIEIYKHKRDTRMLQYKNGELTRYTPEDYDRDIVALRTLTVPIILALLTTLTIDVITTAIVLAFSRKNKMPKALEGSSVLVKWLKVGAKALKGGVAAGSVALAFMPQFRQALAETIFDSWIVDTADSWFGQALDVFTGGDYEEFWADFDIVPGPYDLGTDLDLGRGDTQQRVDDIEDQTERGPVDGQGEPLPSGKSGADEFRDAIEDMFNR